MRFSCLFDLPLQGFPFLFYLFFFSSVVFLLLLFFLLIELLRERTKQRHNIWALMFFWKRDEIIPWPFLLMPQVPIRHTHNDRRMCNQLHDLLRFNSIASHLYLSRGQISSCPFFFIFLFFVSFYFLFAMSLGKGYSGVVVNGA